MHVDVLESIEQLRAVEDNWNAVYRSDPEATYFLSWQWICNWFETARLRWAVLAAKSHEDDDGYIAFFPIRFSTQINGDGEFRHVIRMGGSYYAVYTGFISAPEFRLNAARKFLDHLKKRNWSEVHLDDIFSGQEALVEALAGLHDEDLIVQKKARSKHITSQGEDIDHDIYIVVDLYDSVEEFLMNNFRSRTRRHERRALRFLEEPNGYEVTMAAEENIGEYVEILLDMWSKQWYKNKSYALQITSNTRNIIQRCFKYGGIFLSVLWLDGRAIAAMLALADKERFICFLGGRDLSLGNPSPGLMLHMHAITWATEHNYKIYDLGTGNYGYKYHLGAREIDISRYIVRTRNGKNTQGLLDRENLSGAFDEVRILVRNGWLSRAETACRHILDFDPDHEQAAATLEEIGRQREEAGRRLAEAIRRQKDNLVEEAARAFQAVLERDLGNFEANYYLGAILLKGGRAKEAELHLRRAVAVRPDVASLHNNLGALLITLGRLPEALGSFEEALRVKPDFPEALNNRGIVLKALGREEEALAAFSRAMSLRPDYDKAVRNYNELVDGMAAKRQEAREPAASSAQDGAGEA